jgi:transposase-like protein
VVTACLPRRSIAGIAMEHGINANLLFKWRKQYSRGMSEKACIELPSFELGMSYIARSMSLF